MGRVSYYDEIEIEDFAWDEERRVYHYPCPCGDRFEITKKQLSLAEDVATCPSCSLLVRVIFDYMDFEHCADDEEDDAGATTTMAAERDTSDMPRPDAALQPIAVA